MQKKLTATDRLDIIEKQLDYITKLGQYHFDNGNDDYAGTLYEEYQEWLESSEDYIVMWASDFAI